jgi:hypothetical protein
VTRIHSVIGNIIDAKFHCERKEAFWIVKETDVGTKNKELKLTGAKAVVFSLDQKSLDSFPFLKKSVSGIRKVCDAIAVFEIDNIYYVVAIELKSLNLGKAYVQIENAKYFIDWLKALLKKHGHWDKSIEFYGLISSIIRKQPDKGTSRRDINKIFEIKRTSPKVIQIKNQHSLNLIQLHTFLQNNQ